MTELEDFNLPTGTFYPTLVEWGRTEPETKSSDQYEPIFRELPNYSPGDPNDPSEGFQDHKIIRVDSNTNNFEQVDFECVGVSRFFKESFKTQEAFVDGELRDVKIRETDSSDGFWAGNMVFFEGREKIARRAKSSLQAQFLEKIRISDVTLFPGIYRKLTEFTGPTTDGISVDVVERLQLKGTGDISKLQLFGEDEVLEEYAESSQNMDTVSHIVGRFNFFGYRITAGISKDKIRIYGSPTKRGGSDSEEAPLVTLAFLRKITELSLSKQRDYEV
ncbi:hypothetical protein HTG_11275 [Natrinema mahii]|nr:hypothetical protein HTG_11275 [Natrinema mahii]